MADDHSKSAPVPEMTLSDRFGYPALARRRELARFPVLATQVRCSSGFTHAPHGRLQSLPAGSVERALRSPRRS